MLILNTQQSMLSTGQETTAILHKQARILGWWLVSFVCTLSTLRWYRFILYSRGSLVICLLYIFTVTSEEAKLVSPGNKCGDIKQSGAFKVNKKGQSIIVQHTASASCVPYTREEVISMWIQLITHNAWSHETHVSKAKVILQADCRTQCGLEWLDKTGLTCQACCAELTKTNQFTLMFYQVWNGLSRKVSGTRQALVQWRRCCSKRGSRQVLWSRS